MVIEVGRIDFEQLFIRDASEVFLRGLNFCFELFDRIFDV